MKHARHLPLLALLLPFAAGAQISPPSSACAALKDTTRPVEDSRAYVVASDGRYDAPRSTHYLHRGIDLFIKDGGGAQVEVVAIANGKVAFAGARKRDGNDIGTLVVLEHGECYSVYAFLDDVGSGIAKGKAVSRGTRLGMTRKSSFDLGDEGNAEPQQSEHFHFGLFEAKPGHLANRDNTSEKLLTCPLRWRNPLIVLPKAFGYTESVR